VYQVNILFFLRERERERGGESRTKVVADLDVG
jgi:hypothetical protein